MCVRINNKRRGKNLFSVLCVPYSVNRWTIIIILYIPLTDLKIDILMLFIRTVKLINAGIFMHFHCYPDTDDNVYDHRVIQIYDLKTLNDIWISAKKEWKRCGVYINFIDKINIININKLTRVGRYVCIRIRILYTDVIIFILTIFTISRNWSFYK